ncbi:hypothetical protein EDD86DRAFT_182799, partial [Gorgonomyces haynaldii]
PHLQPNTSLPSAVVPPMISRSSFMSVFESMYDQHDAANRLTAQLKDHLRKTSTLLQTLQSSGQMIEGLVRGHFREMQTQYGERFGAALTDLNNRLVVLEQKLGVSPTGEVFTQTGALKSATPASTGHASLFKMDDRLDSKAMESVLSRLEALEQR